MQGMAVTGAAGTGKTHLLTQSVARLLKQGTPESPTGKILILTSSPRSANDMRARVRNALSDAGILALTLPDALPVVIHTIRSLCEEVLRDKYPELQIMSDFRAWFILRECIRTGSVLMRSSYVRVKDKRSFIREMLELIEAASINSISVDQLPGADRAADKVEDIRSVYTYYKDFCQRHSLLSAFDLVPRALGLLNEYGQQFSHIFIDQYEDFCPGEVQAIKLLSGDHANITIFMDAVRCDPDSAPKLRHDDLRCLTLDTRSAGRDACATIQHPASNIQHRRLSANMAGHVNRLFGRVIYPETEGQGSSDQTLVIAVEETAVDEAEYIARTIKKKINRSGRRYANFAILCNDVESFGRAIRDALRKYSIPCSGGVDVSQDPMVRFVLLCLQVVAQPREDDLVLKWLSSPVAQLDRADIYRVYTRARRKKQELLRTVAEEISLFHKSGERLKGLLAMLDSVRSEIQSGRNIWELAGLILVRSGSIGAGMMHTLPDGEVPRAVALLTEMIRDIEATYQKKRSLPEILDDIKEGLTKLSAPDESISQDSDLVKLMSIREAKGLEFPYVFVPGMVDDFFPARHPARQLLYGEELDLARAALSSIDLPGTVSPGGWREQERQLFYIAMTRAKEEVHLTLAHQYPENEDCEPSPFLADLLGGKEVSADNCAHYGILYQDRTVSRPPEPLPSPEDITSRADLEIACHRYVKELERLDRQKAEEAINLLSSTGLAVDLIPSMPLKEVPVPRSPSPRFSHTSVRTFLSCPRRYFLAHLLKVEVDYGPSSQFGRLVHQVLGIFHAQYPQLCNHDLEELWRGMRGILSDVWNGKIEMEFPSSDKRGFDAEFAHNRLQALSYMKLAEEVLRSYLQGEHRLWDEGRSCVWTEKTFHFSAFGEYTFTGRIDRIDTYALGGHEIIDFKTSAYDTEAESALKSKFLNMDDDPDYRPQDYQLPIYHLAGLDDRDLNPEKLVIYQLRRFSKRTGTPFRRELEIRLDEDTRSGKNDKFLTRADLESVKGDILQTLVRMVSGFYPPEPRDDNVCERECEFSFLCDREESDNQL